MLYGKKLLWSILIPILFTGCATTNLVRYSDNHNCLTTLEGKYSQPNPLTVKYPCIFVKDFRFPKYIGGEFIGRDSNGVLFKPKASGLYSTEPIYFPYDTLTGVVDGSGRIVYGEVNEHYITGIKMNLELENTVHPELDKLILQLIPGESFSYCVDPGEYKIKRITWETERQDFMEGMDIPEIRFTVDSGKANYLGDLNVNIKRLEDKDVILIPFKSYNKGNAAMSGFLFGAIGAAIYASSYEMSEADGVQIVNFDYSGDFIPASKLVPNPLTIYIKEKKKSGRED